MAINPDFYPWDWECKFCGKSNPQMYTILAKQREIVSEMQKELEVLKDLFKEIFKEKGELFFAKSDDSPWKIYKGAEDKSSAPEGENSVTRKAEESITTKEK